MIFGYVFYVLTLSCALGVTDTSKECVGKMCSDKPPISTTLKAVTVSSLSGNESTSINVSYNTTTGNGTNADKSFGVISIETPVTYTNDTSVNYTTSRSPAVVQKTSSTIAHNKTGNAVLSVINIETTAATTTTTAATTTTTTTTTTTAGHALGYVQNIGDQYCDCDFIYGACDINCCCDTDCKNNDLKAFSLCSDKSVFGSIKPESILFDSSLFYIVLDNVPSNYFYPERESVETETEINAILRNRGATEWLECSQVVDTRNHVDLTLGSLHWMYVVSNVNDSDWMAFGVKNNAFGSLCSIQEPVEYLVDKETTCEVYIQNLTEACKNNSELSYKWFYHDRAFRVVQPTYNQSSKTEKVGLVELKAFVQHCVRAANGSYSCWTRPDHPPVPQLGGDGSVCRNAVETVEYLIRHNGTSGVRKLEVRFYYKDLAFDVEQRPVFFRQQSIVKFAWVNQSATAYPRSGKPGYTTGKPVIIVRQKGESNVKPPNDKVVMGTLSLLGANGRDCDSKSRLSVGFNQNVNIKCFYAWKKEESVPFVDSCHRVQSKIISILGEFQDMMVSSRGDPIISKWIPITVARLTLDDQCSTFINIVKIQIFYSYVGSFEKPQATIHGILVNFTSTINTTQIATEKQTVEIPIKSSVIFVDLTKRPIREFAEPPTYEFRLPEDFYYPFLSHGSKLLLHPKLNLFLLFTVIYLQIIMYK